MKNRNHVWKGRSIMGQQTETALGDMETSHLLNTVMFLTKRQKEYDETFAAAKESGLVIDELVINGATCKEWVDRMVKELDRRRRKELEKAKKVLDFNKAL